MNHYDFTAANLNSQEYRTSKPAHNPYVRAMTLHDAFVAAIKSDNKEEARRLAIELKPLIGFLPE